MTRKRTVFTIGHSTHSPERFLSLLAQHSIKALADIRRFPGSRKFPHFTRDALGAVLQDVGIDYHWLESLGGRRGKQGDGPSPANLGLRNTSFRNYADYMQTVAFKDGVAQLLEIAYRKRTALLCAESLYWRCHRRLVSDFLTATGVTVQHILPTGELRAHLLTPGAVIAGERVTYPGATSFFP
jgi:uncharacterized protein (DUF488 family)